MSVSTMHVQVFKYTFLPTSLFYWYRSFVLVNLLLIVCHKRLHLGFIVIRDDISSSRKLCIQFLVEQHIYHPFKFYYSPSLLTLSRPSPQTLARARGARRVFATPVANIRKELCYEIMRNTSKTDIGMFVLESVQKCFELH